MSARTESTESLKTLADDEEIKNNDDHDALMKNSESLSDECVSPLAINFVVAQ
jgi:hypothetical protein